jgi:hypothetical protein
LYDRRSLRQPRGFNLEISDNIPMERNPANFSGSGNIHLTENKFMQILLFENEFPL